MYCQNLERNIFITTEDEQNLKIVVSSGFYDFDRLPLWLE